MPQDRGAPTYSVYICDPFGVRLGDASSFTTLKYSRVINDWSTAEITLPGTFDQSLLRIPDGRIEIWRSGVLVTETTWLIKKPVWTRDNDGNQYVTVEADQPLCLLKEPGRAVLYRSGTANAQTSTFADDALKDIVRANAGSGTSGQRDTSAYLSIAPNLSLAPAISKQFAFRDCLRVMQEIADASAENGVYLAFDVVAPTPDTLEFRTYVGWRGVDHRFPNGINPVLIGPAFGNMGACELSLDYRNEITYVATGGRGEGAQRLIGSAQDLVRMGASPFGWREKFVNATQYSTDTGLDAEAEAAVRGGRPRLAFRGKLLDVPGSRYGVQWDWGDYVTVQAFDQSFDCRIEAITVTVQKGKETIDAWLRSDTVL